MVAVRSTLTLPNDTRLVRFARAYLVELAAAAELPEDAARAFAEVTAEFCKTIVTQAFLPGEHGSYSLHGSVTSAGLELTIHERGVPFDAARLDASPTSAPAASDDPRPALTSGPVWNALLAVTDRAHWHSAGRRGMELHLAKHRPSATAAEELAPAVDEAASADIAPAPAQEYTIRRLKLDTAEAAGVARIMYRAYGYSYANPDLYSPARLVHLNEAGTLVSIVTLDAAGEVVGHLGLERYVAGAVAESGQAAVHPAHRGRHLLERMRATLESEARALGLVGVYGRAVTVHPYSQRMEEQLGAVLCGLYLGSMPRAAHFRAIHERQTQRVSSMLYYRALTEPSAATVYAPPQHRALLADLYGRLAVPVTWGEGAAPTGEGAVTIHHERAWGMATIRVLAIGADTAAVVDRARHDLQSLTGVQAVYLELPLAQAGAPALCSAGEAAGFWFCALGPRFLGAGDALLLQCLSVPLDTDALQLNSDAGRAMRDYVAAERARVGQAR